MAVEWWECEFADLCDITRGASPRPIHEWISDEGIPKPECTEGRPWGQPLKKLEGAPVNLG